MKFSGAIIIIFISMLSVRVFGQDVITFDGQGWCSNQRLSTYFAIRGFGYTSNRDFYTNYGYNFNVNSLSLYYVFQNPGKDKITITTPDGERLNFNSFAAYQVSEVSTDILVVEGWYDSTLKYSESFSNIYSWRTLNLNFYAVNKIVIRVDSSGSGGITDYDFDKFNFGVSVTDVSPDAPGSTPLSYSLGQNYPNPFNPSTEITFSVPHNDKVSLKVYDETGRLVKTLVDGYKSSGVYTYNFNSGKLASGIYFYRLQAGNYISVKKMILLK